MQPKVRQMKTASFTQCVDNDAARMRTHAMFPKVNPLPGSQCESPLVNRNGKSHRGKRRTNMRRHIIITFCSMSEQWIPIRYEPLEKSL